jgi:biopolymer transport protein ExbD
MDKLPSGNVHIAITAEGEVFMNDETAPIEPAALEDRVYPLAQLGQAVYLQGDEAVDYGRIMEVIDAVKAAGAQINLVSQPKPPDR